ncbi:MAG: TatD family hydrolase [Gammaproteobacteria bacterium]|nr:TatD family hydrolase [Gammaproteobacteria bacterium]
MELVDIGANLSHEGFARDLPDVLARAREAGVTRLVVTGASEAESRRAHDIASGRPDMLRATAGVHPHLAREWSPRAAATLRELAGSPAVVALGETGLDFNRDFSPRPAQERAFEAQLELAAELGMPVFMHERDAHERFVEILARHRDRLGDCVIHCFTGNAAELDAYLDLDLHVGITGWICDERRGLHLRELVARIPLERLMLETDAPYLLPRNLTPKPKSRRNEPMSLPHVLREVARCYGLAPETVARATTETAMKFFRFD